MDEPAATVVTEPATETATEPPRPAVTVSVAGTAAKRACTDSLPSLNVAAGKSLQMRACAGLAQSPSQRSKRQPAAGSAVSASPDSIVTESSATPPAKTVPSSSPAANATEPPGPDDSVMTQATGSKRAAARSPSESAQTGLADPAHAPSQPAKP